MRLEIFIASRFRPNKRRRCNAFHHQAYYKITRNISALNRVANINKQNNALFIWTSTVWKDKTSQYERFEEMY